VVRLVGRAVAAVLVLPGAIAFLVPWLLVRPLRAEEFRLVGVVPVALGTFMLAWCVLVFYRRGLGTLAPWDPPQKLVTTGLYGVSRNPMYVAVALILCGWAVVAASWVLTAYAAMVTLAFHLRVVFGEEPYLSRRYGEDWASYRARVPRWLGRVRRRSGARPDTDEAP